MKKSVASIKSYIVQHNEFFIGMGIIIGLLGIVAVIAFFNMPHYAYQPVKACDLFTPAEAQELLGDKVLNVNKNENPKVSGDVASSGCSYTDSNTENMVVAAIAVQSAVNDDGIAKNKADFAASKAANKNTVQDVKDIGDSAYFNKTNGQLNVLEGTKWIKFSYGVGSDPQSNTVEKSLELARKVVG